MHISEWIIRSTARIECTKRDGKCSIGTGFYFMFYDNFKQRIPVLVTNKHVIKDSFQGKIHVSIMDNNQNLIIGRYETVIIDDFENKFIMHPEDNIDLCILPMFESIKRVRKPGEEVCFAPFTAEQIPVGTWKDELKAIEEIIMVGYPSGIWDDINNLPIIRRGITATPIGVDYCGNKEFLVDVACFPGSSGSPVLIFNDGIYTKKSGDTIIDNRILFIGILSKLYQTIQGTIKKIDLPTTYEAQVQMPINLGIAISAEKVLDFNDILLGMLKC
ncbi:MAG: serine protease [Bacillota bacterium]|nr:serine protease [Bacillota bacterium]